jgi:hypothetical protein
MFLILDHSIDFDYLNIDAVSANYDDIDSYSEYIIEKIVGDDYFFSESDDDSPLNKLGGKNLCFAFYYVELTRAREHYIEPFFPAEKRKATFAYRSAATCNGFKSIVSPPPDIA